MPGVNPETRIGDDEPVAVIPPGSDVAVYVTVPFPMYVEAVKNTDASPIPAFAGVPIVGVDGFLPPLERSPILLMIL